MISKSAQKTLAWAPSNMKRLILITALFFPALRAPAQNNEVPRLALIAESPEASAAVDILTAQLSSNDKVRLLERDEIEKVYQEQGLSAGNRDDLKLGRLLGADGLLLLDVKIIESSSPFGPRPVETNLTARLIAVKPGVILDDEKFPVGDLAGWSPGYATHLDSFLPKLGVAAGNAIPIAVVNLRSSVQSADEAETERELKALTIQRLSREQQLFVLERERMQLLEREKGLNSDESAFWDGSYLLEGTVDQNGYSASTITIDARLTPPKGGAPLLFEVRGARTNLVEVINQLADKVVALLNVKSAAPEWNAADEASKFFDEAKWALRWKSYSEAEAAADSAWALGKRDMECARIRIMIRLEELPEVVPPGDTIGSYYVSINDPPNETDCDTAISALESYYEFSRTSAEGVPKMSFHGPDYVFRQPDWYLLGVGTLVAASEVLQHYYFNPRSRPAVAEKLANLRALTRSVAGLISESPSVHDSYFVGNRTIAPDRLLQTFSPRWVYGFWQLAYPKLVPSFFECAVEWGPFWQERPEDDLEVYRELMASPLFFCLHDNFWSRNQYCPWLVAWNEEDQKRIPVVWSGFINDMNASTNYFWRFEAKALACAEARGKAWAGERPAFAGLPQFTPSGISPAGAQLADADEGWKASREALLDFISTNYDSIVDDNGNLPRNDWNMDFLLGGKSEYASRFAAIQQNFLNQHADRVKEIENREEIEEQEEYLARFTPYDWNTFNKVFSSHDYTKEQAAELEPLIAAYKSNLLARATTENEKFTAGNNAKWMDFYLGSSIREALNPPAHPMPSPTFSPAKITAPTLGRPIRPVASAVPNGMIVSKSPPEIPTNIVTVTKFLPIPYNQLSNNGKGIQIFAERWSEGKLLAGLEYHQYRSGFDMNRNWTTANITLSAIAILNPTNQSWDFIGCPESPGADMGLRVLENDTERLILFRGNLYSCLDGPLQEFDFRTQSWRMLEAPGADKSFLFALNDHLYAANDNAIFEIADSGNTRIMASTRRRPAITTLDSLDNFRAVQMFAGPDQSVCASIGQKIYRWDGDDWREILTANASEPPDIFDEAVVFRDLPSFNSDEPERLWIWTKSDAPPELALAGKSRPHPNIINPYWQPPDHQNLRPLWKSPDEDFLAVSPAAFYQTNLYFFINHADIRNVNGERMVMEKDGYHTQLICLSPDFNEPIVIPLRFDASQGQAPSNLSGEPATPWLAKDRMFLDTTAYFSDGQLFFSQRSIAGVWSIPISELQSAIAARKQVQPGQVVRARAAAESNDETAAQDHQ